MRRVLPALLASSMLIAGCGMFGGDGDSRRDDAAAAARTFFDAWAEGDLEAAAEATSDAAAALPVLQETTDRLAVTAVQVEPGDVAGCEDEEPCTVPYDVTLSLRAAGDWPYVGQLTAAPTGEGDDATWKVEWTPAIVHPALTPQTRLGRERSVPARASIVDRQGRPITEDRPVVTVGVVPKDLADPAAVYAALQTAAQVDPARMAQQVAAAQPDHFVEAVTLRRPHYDAVAELLALPGVQTREGTRSLAPTTAFARGVLGAVGPATEELLAEAGPTASSVDLVGGSGLQRTYQQQLAGAPGFTVRLINRDTDQPVGDPLVTVEPTPGAPLQTTLDITVQEAADQALLGVDAVTSLVAVDVNTGGVLAVSNAPEPSDNRAFTGQYPPGSTMKVLTSSALLRNGITPQTEMSCPRTINIGGKNFKNFEFGSFGSGPFEEAFAQSCNTAFVQLTDSMPPNALPAEASAYGLGAEWDLGVPAFSGAVPEPTDQVDEAAAMIGQSRVLASPLAMVSVAAAVATGQPHPPVLVPERTPTPAPAALPAEVVGQLRELMRQTVQRGTAADLADRGEVFAKTGTAEYGTDTPPHTHAWVIGFRGDIAFAVLVEDRESGAHDAVPVADRFLSALP